MQIPFSKPYITGREALYIQKSLESGTHKGNGPFGQRCVELLCEKYGVKHVFLTPSCTAALEMASIVCNLEPGDEVILPSYTFSSTANAIILQRAKPVFCEIHPKTMNIDASRVESLITESTKMIIPIDYAGIPCEIDQLMDIAKKHGLKVVLDAAQSLHSFFKGRPVGTHTDMTAFSFHETKNFSCGEGGALFIKTDDLAERAKFIQEKGTDRSLVATGVRKKYGWVDKGSSFLLSDIQAAVLLAQLENIEYIVEKRGEIIKAYRELMSPYEKSGLLSISYAPAHTQHNNHAFFIIFDLEIHKEQFISRLLEKNIHAYIGFAPLHSSVMGKKLGYQPEDLPLTQDFSCRIVRLPLYTSLSGGDLDYCISSMTEVLQSIHDL